MQGRTQEIYENYFKAIYYNFYDIFIDINKTMSICDLVILSVHVILQSKFVYFPSYCQFWFCFL